MKKAKLRLDDKLINAIRHHKLVSVLLFILIFSLSASAHTKYKDWDNAQALRGLNRDFSIPIEQIEQATGLDLEIKSGCATTQEKFGGGVSYCKYSVSKSEGVDNRIFGDQEAVLNAQSVFKKRGEFDNKEGFKYSYRNLIACEFANQPPLYLSCQMGVRDANKGIKY